MRLGRVGNQVAAMLVVGTLALTGASGRASGRSERAALLAAAAGTPDLNENAPDTAEIVDWLLVHPPSNPTHGMRTEWPTTAGGSASCCSGGVDGGVPRRGSTTPGSGTEVPGSGDIPRTSRRCASGRAWSSTARGVGWCCSAEGSHSTTPGSGTGGYGRVGPPRPALRNERFMRWPTTVSANASCFSAAKRWRNSTCPIRGNGTARRGFNGCPRRARRPDVRIRWPTTARADASCFSGEPRRRSPAAFPTPGSAMGPPGPNRLPRSPRFAA